MSCPLLDMVKFKGRGRGGGKGSGLGAVGADSRSTPTGDGEQLTKHHRIDKVRGNSEEVKSMSTMTRTQRPYPLLRSDLVIDSLGE